MFPKEVASGIAALTICESILLALVDKSTITAAEAREILEDAASVHVNAAMLNCSPDMHQQVAELIGAINVDQLVHLRH
jgi:hypothetical protein